MSREITMTRRMLLVAALSSVAGAMRTFGNEKQEEPGYKVGCYTRPWNRFEYRIALDGIAEAGFEYAGLMRTREGLVVHAAASEGTVREVAREVERRGLKMLSVYGGDFGARESLERGRTGLQRLLGHCATLGCPNLLLSGTSRQEVFENYYRSVRQVCDDAAQKGITITLKPHGGLNGAGTQLRRIVELVRHPRFRITYDPGNILKFSNAKVDPVRDAAVLDGLVAGLCVKDFLPPKRVQVTPGQGVVGFRQLFEVLQKGGFRSGPMLVECVSPARTYEQITAEAARARSFVADLIGTD